MSDTRPTVTTPLSSEELDAPIAPWEGALHVALVVLQLQVLSTTAATVQCGPLPGPFLLVMALFYAWPIAIPAEALIVGVPALVAFAVLRRAPHTGRLRVWRRLQFALLALIVAVMGVGMIYLLSGHVDAARCSFD